MRPWRDRSCGRGPQSVAYAAAGRPAARTPWREAGWCALDLELTGLDPREDHIIAVGMVPIDGGRVQLGAATYTLVRSVRRSSVAAVLTHLLRTADLADAPPLSDALDGMIEALAGRVPVFHHAAVERAFLTPQLRRRGLRMPAAADTEQLGRRWLVQRDGEAPATLPLSGLARRLGQSFEPAHHALADALTTAQAFITLATLLDCGGGQTVGSLLAQNSWR